MYFSFFYSIRETLSDPNVQMKEISAVKIIKNGNIEMYYCNLKHLFSI